MVLYGPNGAGKTNVLEAISLLSPGRGLRRAPAEEIARTPERIGWKVTATLESLHQTHEVVTGSENGTGRRVEIDGKPAPQTALGRIARILWLVPAMDRLWTGAAAERRRFLDRITMSFEPSHADASLAYEKAMRERNRLLKDRVHDARWFDALEAQLARHGAAIIANRAAALARLARARDGAETAFPAADLAIVSNDEAPPEHTADSLREALARGRAHDMGAGRTLTGPHRADLHAVYAAKGIEARLCSTGEQKALLVSMVLANARALAEDFGAPPILLLDEIAAHLDAERRSRLYDEICALGAQAWLTGTGRELFEPMGDRAMHVAVAESDAGSVLEFG